MSKSTTFSVVSMILNVLGVYPVGCPTVVTSWFDATSTTLVAPLGDLHSVIATERNIVHFFDIVQLLE